jgi:alpha-L-arabinofuranosidase
MNPPVRPLARTPLLPLVLAAGVAIAASALAADFGKITVQVDQPGARINPMLFGLMTEEINHSYDGGLYAELIQNRIFRDSRAPRGPAAELPDARPVEGVPCWYLVTSSGAEGAAVPDTADPINTTALTTSLKLTVSSVPSGGRVGVASTGYWGIPARPDTTYRCSFHAKASDGFAGPLTVAIESNDGKTVHASATVPAIADKWQRYAVTLKTGQLAPTAANRFVISAGTKGTVNFNLVSLFPPVFQERAGAALGGRPTTGFRPDIMKLLDDMHPAFLRFPGGNYVEGSDFASRFDFKTTIGPWEQRPGHGSPWGYRSSDGLGLLEFLEWCEELKMEPVLAVYAGLNLDNGRDVKTGEALKPLIQDALDEIQYITGDVNTVWGARRARDGHPAPFKLTYVEIGNEDFLNRGAATYRGPEGRFAMFYNAIKSKYPPIQVVATTSPGEGVKLDVIDNHHYMPPSIAIRNAHLYDNADRNGPKIMEGEWASQEVGGPGAPRPLTPTFQCALSDAAFLTGLQRNADMVIMSCYAPLFARLEPGGSQWRTNLIGYNGLTSYGSPPYYVQKMFCNARGDQVLPITAITPQTIPTPAAEPTPPPAPGPAPGRRGARSIAPPDPKEPIFACASKEDSSGDIIIKVVNVFDVDQTLTVELVGAKNLKGATGQVMVGKPSDTNTVDEPIRTVPKDFVVNEVSSPWNHTFPENSITVIRFKTR